jgi:hypothetical protein
MKALIAVVLLALAGSVSAGTVCSRYDGPQSCNTAVQFPAGDPIPATTDEGLGAGTGAE